MTNYGRIDSTSGNVNIYASGSSAGKSTSSSAAEDFAAALKANLDAHSSGQTVAAADGSTIEETELPEGKVLAPDGKTLLDVHDWEEDPTDYVEVLRNAVSGEAFSEYAQSRERQAEAQGIDISGNGSQPSTAELFNEWYAANGADPGHAFHVYDKEGFGYYGMDSEGHWGYYLDQGLTQKHPDGGWDLYKASDGGRALFDNRRGYLWPSDVRDESRAGKTVTLTAGAKAFKVTYNDRGIISSVVNLSKTKGIDGRTLDLPTAKALDDRGVAGQALLRQTSGLDYVGLGSGVSQANIRGGDFRDWEAIMTGNGYTPPTTAAEGTAPAAVEPVPAAAEGTAPSSAEEAAPAAVQPKPATAEGTAPAAAEETTPESAEITPATAEETTPESTEVTSTTAEETAELQTGLTENAQTQQPADETPAVQSAPVQQTVESPAQQSAGSEEDNAELLRQLSVEQFRARVNISRQADAQAFLDSLDREREEDDRR